MSQIYKYCLCLILSVNSFYFFSQSFGSIPFSSLDAFYNARSLGLGGSFFSVETKDNSVGVSNPSLISSINVNKLSISQIIQPIGVQYGLISYGSLLNKERNLYQLSTLRYVNYGRMKETDITGTVIGTFNPMDIMLSHAIGYKLAPNFFLGCQATLVGGFYLNQAQVGLGFDLSATWILNENTSMAGVVKNIGAQKIIKSDYEIGILPFEIQAIISHKLKYAPFRFSIFLHHLNKFDISYFNPNEKGETNLMTGERVAPEKVTFFEKISQHIVPQAEILLGKSVEIRCGYNFYTRQNIGITNNPSFSGLSFGFGFSFQRFSIDYGFKRMSASGSFNGITLVLNLNEWRRK